MPEAVMKSGARPPLSAERARKLLLIREATEALGRATRLAAMALRAPVAWLGVVDDDEVCLASHIGLTTPWTERGALPLNESFARMVVHARQGIVIDSVATDPLTRDIPQLENYPRGAFCAVAVRIGDEAIGVLAVSDTTTRQWSVHELDLLRDVAATIVHDLELYSSNDTLQAEPAPLTVPDGIMPEGYVTLDSEWHFTFVNERAEIVLRSKRENLLGRSIWDCFPGLIGTLFHHEYLRVAADQQSVEFEDFCPPLDAWIETRAYPSAGGIAIHVRDVSARWAAQSALREREARYRSVFEDTTSAIFMTSAEGSLLEANRATLDLFGITLDEALRCKVTDFYAEPEDREHFRRQIEEQGSVSDFEVKLRRKDGAVLDCVISATSQRSRSGEILGFHGTVRDVTEQKRAQEKLVESAFQDPLTQLPNRAVFHDRLERLLKHSKRRAGYRFAVLFIDIDRFKNVNDTFGHHAGDTLLSAVARRLEKCVRQEDTVARIGGDEFGVLLDAVSDVGGVTIVAERILAELCLPVTVDGRDVNATASVGVALSMTGYDTADDIVRDADAAMYRAKAGGRAAYAVFDTEMYSRARAQLALESELRNAMHANQLALHYHPVVALEDGGVTGLEALVRWDHPERGILLPGEFMPLAETTGLIVEIGWWVLREACRQLRSWQLEYPRAAFKLTMSVNLSAKQFVQPNLVQKIDAILEETALDPASLRLDLTEAVVMQNADLAAKMLSQLRERGIHICLDDFGSGYSSLRDLRALPISTLKIDPSFVRDMEDEGEGHAIVQTIIALGRSMAIDAIAEGVETPEQLALLRNLGTRFAQGFLFSLPLDSDAAKMLIAETVVH
jgi:diguanylate cyclase (GGDEF)-like protein/PAS domain S-box-containing protein